MGWASISKEEKNNLECVGVGDRCIVESDLYVYWPLVDVIKYIAV